MAKTLCTVALMISPPLLTTAWLSIDRSGWMPQADYLTLGLALAVGAIGVAMLPASRRTRAIMAVLYVIVMGPLVVLWALSYVCIAFAGCL